MPRPQTSNTVRTQSSRRHDARLWGTANNFVPRHLPPLPAHARAALASKLPAGPGKALSCRSPRPLPPPPPPLPPARSPYALTAPPCPDVAQPAGGEPFGAFRRMKRRRQSWHAPATNSGGAKRRVSLAAGRPSLRPLGPRTPPIPWRGCGPGGAPVLGHRAHALFCPDRVEALWPQPWPSGRNAAAVRADGLSARRP